MVDYHSFNFAPCNSLLLHWRIDFNYSSTNVSAVVDLGSSLGYYSFDDLKLGNQIEIVTEVTYSMFALVLFALTREESLEQRSFLSKNSSNHLKFVQKSYLVLTEQHSYVMLIKTRLSSMAHYVNGFTCHPLQHLFRIYNAIN